MLKIPFIAALITSLLLAGWLAGCGMMKILLHLGSGESAS